MSHAYFAPHQQVVVVPTRSAIGGGSLPGQTLESWAVSVPFRSADEAAKELRLGDPPIVARIVDDAVLFDLRAVGLGDDGVLVRRIGELAAPFG
jgi:L-seryl-tRNA(Ser) seleniumtransferase